MIFKYKPKDFKTKVHVVGCLCEHQGKLLLLLRQDTKPQGNTWSLPSGKKDKGETLIGAMVREIYEETGKKLEKDQLKYFKKLFVRFPEYDFFFHIYHSFWEDEVVTITEKEHKQYIWISVKEALGMNLIQDLNPCIRQFYKI